MLNRLSDRGGPGRHSQKDESKTMIDANRRPTTTDATGDDAYLHSDEMTLILTNLPPASAVTLARFAQVSQSFAAEGGVVETALRSRHGPQPAALPDAFDTWLAKLLWDERRSGVHAPVLSVGRTHGATVHDGRCFVWGSEYVSYAGREVPGLLGVGLRNQARHVYQGNVDTPKPLANVTNAVSVSCGREASPRI